MTNESTKPQVYVYTCAKCARPTILRQLVASVRCCGKDIDSAPVQMDAARANNVWTRWKSFSRAAKGGAGKR